MTLHCSLKLHYFLLKKFKLLPRFDQNSNYQELCYLEQAKSSKDEIFSLVILRFEFLTIVKQDSTVMHKIKLKSRGYSYFPNWWEEGVHRWDSKREQSKLTLVVILQINLNQG